MLRPVYATTVQTELEGTLLTEWTSLSDILGLITNIVLGVGWALVFIMLAGGFIKYITSRGETKATDQARNWLTFAALGGVGLLFLTLIMPLILNLLGGGDPISVTGITDFMDGGAAPAPINP